MKVVHRSVLTTSLSSLASLVVLTRAVTARADWLSDLARPVEDALLRGDLLVVAGGSALAGLATSLTPCVYPMIAITVSVFGARKAASRAEAAKLSAAFMLGVVALFTPLGLLAGTTELAFGSLNASPYVMLPLSLFFVALALSMFGLFDLDLPGSFKNRLARLGGGGLRGAFLIGLTTGVVAAPCTGPVVAALLTYIAATGDLVTGSLSMCSYAVGLSLPFFLVGTFMMSLPKSGRWMSAVKGVFGVMMLVLAVTFALPHLPETFPRVRSTVWLGVTLGLLALGLGAALVQLRIGGASPWAPFRKTGTILVSTMGSLSLVAYLSALPDGASLEWREDFAVAREEARSEGRPFLIDFGADWCAACKELEHETFADPRVIKESQRFMAIRVDLSPRVETPEKWALLREYGQSGLPFVVLHDGEGREALRVTSVMSPDELVPRMREIR
jgi:thioredoxin:protein disulfide reductase